MSFRADIEGLRAFAIVFVVLFHAGWHRFAGGYLGVDVFFVLSGFLITGLLLDEVNATGTVSLSNFWARRARRLLPAAATITIVVLVANAVILSPFEQITRADTARAFAVYGSNILFAIRSTDYFGGSATRDPLLHTWSLSVEEQFYLFFAPLLVLMALWARRHGPTVFARRFAIVTVALSLLSLAGCVLLVRRYPAVAFYLLPVRAWEFGLGALAVLGVRRWHAVPRPANEVLSLAGLAALVAPVVMVRADIAHPLGIVTLVPTLGTTLLILTGSSGNAPIAARLFSTAPMRLLGRLSYSWYLWHWPMLVYLRELVPEPTRAQSLAVAFLSLVPAAITYKLVESPVRFSKQLQRRPRQVVVATALLAACTVAAGTAAIAHANNVLAEPRFASILAVRTKPRVYADQCQAPLLAVTSPRCEYGPARNDTTVVLFGDSHAAQWFPAFDSVATLRGWKLVNLTKTGCPAVTVGVPNLGRRYVECDTWRQYAIARIVALRPALVVLTGDRTYNVLVGSGQPLTDTSGLARREWNDGMRRTLAAMAPSHARLAVLEDTPQPGFDVPRCLVTHIDKPALCDVKRAKAFNPLVTGSERAAVAATPGVAWFSMNDQMCDDTLCPVARDGLVRFSDKDHLAVRYAASLAPALSRALTGILGEARTVSAP